MVMGERLENKCKKLIENREYDKCDSEIRKAMSADPHSAVQHNLMGILLEVKGNHILAMKHFRAAYALNPTYVPARFNMEKYRQECGPAKCAYT